MKQIRYKLPSKRKIIDYWLSRSDIFGEDYWLDEHNCFACNNINRIERAHIEPYCYSQNNDVSNLHLLCGACHIESENLTGDQYWNWFKYQRTHKWKNIFEHAYDWAEKCGYNIRMIQQESINTDITQDRMDIIKAQSYSFFKNDINLANQIIKLIIDYQEVNRNNKLK